MANIKNFGIVGVGAGVQFGKGGAQLIQTAGTFAAKNATGNAFVRFQIADGTSGGDAITFQQHTNAVTSINSNVAAVAANVANTNTGAGLNLDGSYAAPVGTNYLANSISLKDAAALLDAALFAETGARVQADLNLANSIANVVATSVGLQSEIDLIETSVGLGTDGSLTLTAGNYLANAVSLVNAVHILDGAIGNVSLVADAANATANQAYTDAANAMAAVGSTNANVALVAADLANTNANVSSVAGLVTGLRTDVDSNSALLSNTVSRVTVLESSANSTAQAVSDEANARIAADSALSNAIASTNANVVTEAGLRTQADSDEANARIAADSTLSNSIAVVASDLSNTNTALSALSANAVLKDGSVAFTGDQSMGGHALTNVATPNALTDAATKGYVDAKVSTLANAFDYIGTAAGGADANTATDINGFSSKHTGAYYKVTTQGYFTNGNATAYYNTNDGLVFNTDTANVGFDKIDNTDSTTAGTAGEITVAGSVDTGFVVGIDGAYTAARQLEVSNEANARIAADAVLSNSIASVQANVVTEAGLRAQGDLDNANAIALVQANVVTEAGLRAQGDSDNANAIAATNANVVVVASNLANTNSNVATLTGRVETLENSTAIADAIAAEANARIAADSALSNAIASTNANVVTEAGLRAQGDSDNANAIALVQANVVTEAGLRAQADSDLSNAIASTNANVVAVAGNVANAQAEIDAIETGAGLGTNGAYAANATSHYLANATSLFDADNKLDAEIANVYTTLSTLSQDTIKTNDNLNSVHVADKSITMALNVGGNATVVANIVATANTNTSLLMDFGASNQVMLAAKGISADVDLRLAAQGAGHVIIGETGVGVIQADDGYDMTIAGGTGANLNLLGAKVNIGDASGSNVAVFAGVGGATAWATVTNGNTAVTFGAAGAASNLDLVFAPKGTGVVNMSSARVINVANATLATDAVNKGQLDTAISTAAVGVVKTVVATLPATSGEVVLGTITGTILRVRVLVSVAYDAGSTIVVGNTGTANDLAADTDIDEGTAGIYVVETAKDYSATTVSATVTNATGSNGSAKVVVEYLSA